MLLIHTHASLKARLTSSRAHAAATHCLRIVVPLAVFAAGAVPLVLRTPDSAVDAPPRDQTSRTPVVFTAAELRTRAAAATEAYLLVVGVGCVTVQLVDGDAGLGVCADYRVTDVGHAHAVGSIVWRGMRTG